jgi:hypothetical protein
VDFVFEKASELGPSTAENLTNVVLGAGYYLNFDPPSKERGKFGIAAQTGGGYPIDLFQRVEPGVYADTVEFSILAEQQKREKLWAKRVVEQPFTKGIAICGVDAAEALKRVVHDFFGGRRFAEIERKHETFRSRRFRLLGSFLQVKFVSRDQNERRKIPG